MSLSGKIRFALWILSACVILCSCRKESRKTILFKWQTQDTGATFTIKNEGSKTAFFTLNIDSLHINSPAALKQRIRSLKDEYPGEPLERKAWRFVVDNHSDHTFLRNNTSHDPLVMLHTFGYPYAGDNARLLAHIWQVLGYRSRVWDLNGHMVPEVKVDGRWNMYDPTLDVYYLTGEKAVAAVEELIDKPALISSPVQPLPLIPFKNPLQAYHHVYRYSSALADIYSSAEDNYTRDWVHNEEFIKEAVYSLPPGGTIEFPVGSPVPDTVKHWSGKKIAWDKYLRLTIPAGWSGKIEIPLLLTYVKGKHVKVENAPVHMNVLGYNVWKDTSGIPGAVTVSASNDKRELYYLINLKLYAPNTAKSVSISGIQTRDIKLHVRKYPGRQEEVPMNYAHFIQFEKHRDTLQQKMFSNKRPIKQPEDVKRNLETYFSLSSDLTEQQKQLKVRDLYSGFLTAYNKIPSGERKRLILHSLSEPGIFLIMIYVLEEYPPGTLEVVFAN